MKRLFATILILLMLTGCTATLSMTDKNGMTMTLSNYAVTEVYKNGILVQRVMVPDNSWFAGVIDKIGGLLNSVLKMVE